MVRKEIMTDRKRAGIQKVMAMLRRKVPAKQFNMRSGDHREDVEQKNHCGTPCCIGGHCVVELGDFSVNLCDAFQQVTGLSQSTAWEVCYPNHKWFQKTTTKAHALRMLQHLHDTGRVDWDATAKA